VNRYCAPVHPDSNRAHVHRCAPSQSNGHASGDIDLIPPSKSSRGNGSRLPTSATLRNKSGKPIGWGSHIHDAAMVLCSGSPPPPALNDDLLAAEHALGAIAGVHVVIGPETSYQPAPRQPRDD
jgi:hypothetical protein